MDRIEITDELLADIEAKAKAATPGDWKTHLVDDTLVVAPDGTEVATTCDSSQAEREDGYNVEYERMEADATYIARMDPPAALALVAAYRSALARIAELEAKAAADLADYETSLGTMTAIARRVALDDAAAVLDAAMSPEHGADYGLMDETERWERRNRNRTIARCAADIRALKDKGVSHG